MESCWLHKSGKPYLIVFCSGWGMDEHPFALLPSDQYDVLCFYDYRSLQPIEDIQRICASYTQKILLSWSMGVWAGQQLFTDHPDIFDRLIALNGTLCPIDPSLGIPPDIFLATLNAWGEQSRLKFYRRMFSSSQDYERFMAHAPRRSVAEQKEELSVLYQKTQATKVSTSIYDTVCVGMKDRIFPGQNQKKYWQNAPILCTDYSHFPFYSFPSWDVFLTQMK